MLQSTFAFTNQDDNANVTVKPTDLKLVDNYTDTEDDPKDKNPVVRLSNKTCPLGKDELVTFQYQTIATVNTNCKILNPAKVQSGVQYHVRLDETLTTTSSEDPAYRVDEPVVLDLVVRHQSSGNVDGDTIVSLLKRLVGAAVTSDGKWRFDDLMRNGLTPKTN